MMRERDNDAKGMLVFLDILKTLSSSTVVWERWFSCMKLQKSIICVSPSNQLLDGFKRIAISNVLFHKLETKDHVDSWIANSKGKRDLERHRRSSSKKTRL